MAFDGITVAALTAELNKYLLNGRIYKIAQPEKDELLLTIKNNKKDQYKLLISAGASLPLMYLTDNNKPSPMTAPNFCMLLRKHISNGRIISIIQPEMERIVDFEIEHLNELGDVCRKHLIIELMGKHSNIIFCDADMKIIDSIKHVSVQVSSVREVLPGRDYFIPKTITKYNPLTVTQRNFINILLADCNPIGKALYMNFTGLSPMIAHDICHQAGLDSDIPAGDMEEILLIHLYNIFSQTMDIIKHNSFYPIIIYQDNEPVDFAAIMIESYASDNILHLESISAVLEKYYADKDSVTRIRQRSATLRQVVQTLLSKDYKKYDLQLKQIKDTEKREKFQLYGELLTAYGYNIEGTPSEVTVDNYHTGEKITIPLNNELSPMENAKKYFERYNKLKRTYEALTEIIKATKEEIDHLESISTALDIAPDENSLKELKEEMIEFGYIRRKSTEKKSKYVSKPLHYISSEGFDIYVGKNNYQNEELTFKVATGNDWWFHAKGMPGSHVIVKSDGKELPDSVFEEAGRLAAFYSKARGREKVEIDYIQRKHVKKVNGGKPGFVIYHTNYSMLIDPDIQNIKQV